MKLGKSFILFVLTLTLFASRVQGSEVRDLQYQYAYDEVAKDLAKDAFVICDDCPTRSGPKVSFLQAARNLLSIRMSSEPPPLIRQMAKAPEETKPMPEVIVQPKEVQCPKETTIIQTKVVGMVLFSLGESDLDKDNRRMLDSIADRVAPGSSVSVFGYTCDIGSDSYDDRLSQERADMVAAYLKNKGLKVDKIQGRGKTNPLSPIHRELNRRAEINIKNTEDKKE